MMLSSTSVEFGICTDSLCTEAANRWLFVFSNTTFGLLVFRSAGGGEVAVVRRLREGARWGGGPPEAVVDAWRAS
jgi:hypothetical protein